MSRRPDFPPSPDRPLRVQGYTKSKLVPPRFKSDEFATPEAFRARARYFNLLDEERLTRLDRPSLVSSSHGEIGRILFTIPYWVFFPDSGETPEEVELIRKYAATFRSIIEQLPAGTSLLVFTQEVAQQAATDFLTSAGVADRTELVFAPNTMRFTVWAEDAYCICNDLTDDETFFVEPASFRRAEDAYIADRIAPTTNLERTQVQLYFQGGNVLIGDEFWLIGADYPANSLELGFIVPNPGETELQAIKRVYGQYLDSYKQLHVIGSRVPVSAGQRRPVIINGELWHEYLHLGNQNGTVQPLFHIDMFISLAGHNANGQYTVLVADPQMAADILGEPLPDGAMQDVFDDIASQFGELSFNVVRNPIPMAYDDDSEKKRYWYFATSNNVIVKDSPKTVWIPTYGHAPWNNFTATDERNRQIWIDLDYEVKQLSNFHPFAANLGAAHCISKYLARAGCEINVVRRGPVNGDVNQPDDFQQFLRKG